MLGKAIEKAYNLDQSEDRWLFRNENKGVFLWIISVHTSNPNLGSLRALPLEERGLRPGVGLTQTAGFRGAARGLRKAVGPGSSSVEGQWGSSASPWGFVGSGASHTGIHQHHLVLTLPGKTGVGCCPWNPPQSSFPPLYSGDCIPRCPFTETLGGFLGASVQLSLSVVSDFATPWTAARRASLSWSLLQLSWSLSPGACSNSGCLRTCKLLCLGGGMTETWAVALSFRKRRAAPHKWVSWCVVSTLRGRKQLWCGCVFERNEEDTHVWGRNSESQC